MTDEQNPPKRPYTSIRLYGITNSTTVQWLFSAGQAWKKLTRYGSTQHKRKKVRLF